jgi:thymidylate synthase (FAD)
MNPVEPKVFLVGETRAHSEGVRAYLERVGASTWVTDSPTDAEGLIEMYGRGCYRSFAPGLNPNVTKVREGNKTYLANIISQQHGSVFEHVVANFVFLHVSRVFTHELVRHRVGTAISQESLRYVRLDDLDFWMPPEIASNDKARAIFEEAVAASERWQSDLAEALELDGPNVPFDYKKQMTSAMRRIAPEGLATMIGWSANFRTLRHVIALRTSPHAEHEIRVVFAEVAEIAIKRWPNAFGDFTITLHNGIPWYQSPNPKI